ncbi:MAG: LemA family protein [Actinomycetota bacterium]
MIVVWILLGLAVLLLLWGVFSYNRFVSQRNLIKDAWSNISTELQRRYDLIPNLVETVKGYAQHEQGTFEAVTKARAAATAATGSPEAQAAAEGPLIAALRQLLAVAEAYPDLKANENFLALQSELANTEDRLQTSRRFYNANVRQYNERVQSVPSNVIANMFKFQAEEYFEVEDSIRDAGAPQVNFTQEGPGVSYDNRGSGANRPPGGEPPSGGGSTSAPPPGAPPAAPPPPAAPGT